MRHKLSLLRTVGILVLIAFSLGIAIVGQTVPESSKKYAYPNEIAGFELYAKSRWRVLIPSESNMAQVRKVLGNPDEVNDIAAYSEPYPGDTSAKEPVFTYQKLIKGWEVLVYFSRYCFREHPVDPTGTRICSVDLIPKAPIDFSQIRFSTQFVKKHVQAADASWDEYTDASGLQYSVYTGKPAYGADTAGDLNRISYGFPTNLH